MPMRGGREHHCECGASDGSRGSVKTQFSHNSHRGKSPAPAIASERIQILINVRIGVPCGEYNDKLAYMRPIHSAKPQSGGSSVKTQSSVIDFLRPSRFSS